MGSEGLGKASERPEVGPECMVMTVIIKPERNKGKPKLNVTHESGQMGMRESPIMDLWSGYNQGGEG